MAFDYSKRTRPRITAKIAGRALHPLLAPFAVAYFLTACICDLAYIRNGAAEFVSITEALLIAGLIMGAAAAVVSLIDFLGDRNIRALADTRTYLVASGLVLVLELYNLDVRYTDGPTAILPTGLLMSLAVLAVFFATPWKAWGALYRSEATVRR